LGALNAGRDAASVHSILEPGPMSGAADETTELKPSIATGNYQRTREVEAQIDGMDPIFMLLSLEEIFSDRSQTEAASHS
jgi:hypothetical protein